MSKRRAPGSFEAAIATVIDAIGADAAGDAIGKSANLVYKASDPETGFMISLDQAVMLDQACVDAGHTGAPPIMAAYMAHLSADAELPVGRFQSVKDELLDMLPANAAFAEKVLRAHNLGDLTPNQEHEVAEALERVIREAQEVVYALKHECAGPKVRAVG